MKDLVGFYQSRPQAERVKDELLSAGFDRDDITLYDRTGKDEANFWESIKNAFGYADEDDQRLYAEATRRGAVAVGLSLDRDDSAPRAMEIMQRHHPIDLNTQSAQWKQQSTQTTAGKTAAAAGSSAQGSTVIPVVEEQLKVGKRAVQSGGVRIHSRITEKPVQEQVNLREEHVDVQRRAVDRPMTDADKAAFRERTIEVTETREEPVVSKQARVVEEIAVNKTAAQRTETVRDTVRRTDVDVQQPASAADTQVGDRFARELASDERFRGRDWASMEPEARRSFEQRYPGNKWEQYKDAVHRGYERVRRKV
jgi:uncharacterized protein (TIGR02271 family)